MMYEPKTTVCPHCQGQLSWLRRMKGDNFCSPEHRECYLSTLDSAILARLAPKKAIRQTRKPSHSQEALRSQISALVLAPVGPN